MRVCPIIQVVFKEKKRNHFYAKRNGHGELEVVQEPQKGEKYYEVPVVAGGSK